MNTLLFRGFPADPEWARIVATREEIGSLQYTNHPTWVALSGGSRLVRDGASNVGATFHIDDDPRANIQVVARQVAAGRRYPAVILAATDRKAQHVIVEGHNNETGLAVARYLLGEKLRGQQRVLQRVSAPAEYAAALTDECDRLEHSSTLDDLLECEREAALVYWRAWKNIGTRFVAADQDRVPDHWQRFGQRHSPLTSAPRLPVNPANAVLGYLYALLAAEARIGLHAVGLTPTLGIVHADCRHRDSFALDVIEAVRPAADEHLLDLLATHVFRADDFYDTRRGNCRILPPLTHTLAQGTAHWAALLAPVCEHVARLIGDDSPRISRLATTLTGTNRSASRKRRRPVRTVVTAPPRPERVCARCGGPLPHQKRIYCQPCEAVFRQEQAGRAGVRLAPIHIARAQTGHDATHGGEAAIRRGSRNTQRKTELREWDEQHGKLVDLSAFERDILPGIRNVPLSRLQRATGLSLRYVSQIRRGEKTPHPRHWAAIKASGRE